MAFFGATGLIFDAIGTGAALTLILAVVVGVVAGTINSAAFAWLRRNSASSEVSDRELEGTIAIASMPIGPDRRGKITVEIAGAREWMTASPADDSEIEQGSRVVIVGVDKGVAIVAGLGPELELD
jgi:membrane protein implicated in regulation of membrane protease activity